MSQEPSSSNQYSSERSAGSGPPIRLIVFAVVLIVAVVFVLQNRDMTQIDFLFFEIRSRVWTAMATSMVLGVVLDRLFVAWWRRWRSSKN